MGRKNYDEKLLVVVNPWPPSGPKHPQFINNVASWFEVMLRKNNKNVKVEAIYQQRTHRHIIIELPEEATVKHILGAHHWDRFIAERYMSGHRGKVSYIYEYNYEVLRHPSQINWHAAIPSYMAIDPAFPIISPYPLPSPAPAARLPYAAALPPELRLSNNATPPASRPEDNDSESGATKSDHVVVVKSEKKDPCDEEEEFAKILRGPDPHELLTAHVKTEPPDDYEPSSELVSLLSEHLSANNNSSKDDYEPSSELVSLLSEHLSANNNSSKDLPRARVKVEGNHHQPKELQIKREDSEREAKRKERSPYYGNDDEPHLKRVKEEYS